MPVHAGLNISADDFTALIEDLVKSLNSNNVPQAAQLLLLGALAPLLAEIVQIPGPRQVPVAQLGGTALRSCSGPWAAQEPD
jgi:hypothetical protein